MRSWVLLLLVAPLIAARVRVGSAETDPLPPSLVDLVRNSPISSVDELKLLLQQETNAIEEEEDEHDIHTNTTHGRFSRSLEEVPLAQQAVCKVRTEVMEVTRSMLDRRNANFILWPSCVEVQRCSGCCNSQSLQCVATATSSRYLQVIKIQFINKKQHNDLVIISVEDHVSCRCQPVSSSTPLSLPVTHSSIQSNPNPPVPPPQQTPPSSHRPLQFPRPVLPALPKTPASKADLHRHDDLKHNQQHYGPEQREPVARPWQQGSYTQLVHWTQPRPHQATTYVQSGPSEARAEHSIMGSTQQAAHGSGFDGSREEKSSGEGRRPDHAQRQQQLLQHQQRHQHQGGAELKTQLQLSAPQADSASPPGSTSQPPKPEPSPTKQKDSASGQSATEVANRKLIGENEGNEREESGSSSSRASAGGKETPHLAYGDGLSEEERRQKLLEMVQREPDQQLHPRHRQQRPKPTTFKTAPSTVGPVSPSARKAPFHPASPRRRRKHRKRISKAAMRAMIM